MTSLSTRTITALSFALFLVTILLYFRVSGYPFIVLDDRSYIITNSHVSKGITWEGVVWAFSSISRSNWFPLTWLTHMLDVSLYGTTRPGMHHVTNLVLHACSTVLLFRMLLVMTGASWRCFVVALLFAIHPLHVESVAWVAERKDVLSGFWFMLVLLWYARYALTNCKRYYWLSLVATAMGLMSKPMLVSVPLVLLLVDIWPLGRSTLTSSASPISVSTVSPQRLLIEKLPFVLPSIAVSTVTVIAQQKTMSSLSALPLVARIENALISYVTYLSKTFWPGKLAIYYPYPTDFAIWKTAGAGMLLAGVTITVFRFFKKHPHLAVGWLWFVLMLVPVIGLVQVGRQAMADRYMYLPIIGILIMVVWSLPMPDRLASWQRTVLASGLVAGCLALGSVAYQQIGYWRDGVTLFQHALDITSDNYQARKGLAIELSQAGRNLESIPHYYAALRLFYEDAETHRNLAFAFEELGKIDHTIFHMREAFRIDPGDSMAYFTLQHHLMQRLLKK